MLHCYFASLEGYSLFGIVSHQQKVNFFFSFLNFSTCLLGIVKKDEEFTKQLIRWRIYKTTDQI